MNNRKSYPYLRVGPEWESSGSWAPKHADYAAMDPMIPYEPLDLPQALVARFTAWQANFNEYLPDVPSSHPKPSWEVFHAEQRELAHEPHAVVGGCVQWVIGDIVHTVGDGGPGVKLRKSD